MTRVAVVGAGLAAAPHLASLRDLASKVDVTWFVALTRDRIANAAASFPGARITTSLDDVLDDATVAAALVLTPPNTHLEVVSRLAAAGKHVLLEKPLEVDTVRARQLVDACRTSGVHLGIVLQHRMRAATVAMIERAHDGRLGEMVTAAVDLPWWRPQSYYDQPGRGTRARDGGGVLMTQGIHLLDVFVAVAGMPSEVAAFAGTSAMHRMECEDVVAAALRYTNGAVATVNATTAAYPGFPERIVYSGTKGTATLAAGRLDVRYVDGHSGMIGEEQSAGSGADPMDFSHQPHRAVIEDFVDAIAADREPSLTGAGALRVHRLIDRLLESAASRTVVRVDPDAYGSADRPDTLTAGAARA